MDIAINPNETIQQHLLEAFSIYDTTVCQGMMAASYLVASILPEFVYEAKSLFEKNNDSFGISLDIKSHGLPIGFFFFFFLNIYCIFYIYHYLFINFFYLLYSSCCKLLLV
jgi:hypothetical protein